MEKLLKDVLIKLNRGGMTYRVLLVDNIPESLFYDYKHPRKINMVNGQPHTQHWVADTEKPKVRTLKEHIKESQNGDGGLVFNMENTNSKDLYNAVDRYITTHYPSNKVVPKAVINAVDPTDKRSQPLALKDVPRVVLPVLSPSASADAGDTTAALDSSSDIEAVKRQAVEEYKAAQKAKAIEKMAKARAARSK